MTAPIAPSEARRGRYHARPRRLNHRSREEVTAQPWVRKVVRSTRTRIWFETFSRSGAKMLML